MGIGIAYDNSLYSQEFLFNEKQLKRLKCYLKIALLFLCVACVVPSFAHADNDNLMDLFSTAAFTGSWEVFSKVNFIGKALNVSISFFCLMGLVFTVVRFTLTMLYKSAENTFDRVYELKQSGKGDNVFGIRNMFNEVRTGNFGTGVDAVIGFVFMLLPNVKAYSDYNPEKMVYNLKEDDTITTYFLKMSIPTIMTLFFFTIGFDGTLWQAYGNVVNGISVVAKRAVEVNLAGYVNKAMNAGAYYSFSFNTRSELGKLQKNIATSIYNKLLLKMESYDTTTMQNVGSRVETWVLDHFSASDLDVLNKAKGAKKIKDDATAAKNLSFTCCINSNSELGAEGGNCYAAVREVDYFSVAGMSTKMYVHVYVTKKANADETDYFKVKTKSSGTTTEGTPTNNMQQDETVN